MEILNFAFKNQFIIKWFYGIEVFICTGLFELKFYSFVFWIDDNFGIGQKSARESFGRVIITYYMNVFAIYKSDGLLVVINDRIKAGKERNPVQEVGLWNGRNMIRKVEGRYYTLREWFLTYLK